MKRKVKVLSALVAGMLGVVGVTSSAHAILSKAQYKCQTTIAKEGAKFINGVLKARQKCIEKNLKEPLSCPGADLTKLEAKLESGLAKSCDFAPFSTTVALSLIGFPGVCVDPNPGNGFTLADLTLCIKETHEDLVDQMIDLQYDPDIQAGPLADTALKCQKEIGKNSGKFVAAVLKAVQKCRNDTLNCHFETIPDPPNPDKTITVCKLDGIRGKDCATLNQKTIDAIAKAKGKAEAAITAKCIAPDPGNIQACEPDQSTGAAAALCETLSHQLLTDNPDNSSIFDPLDLEYALPATCGDNHKNRVAEECDGVDDANCPGQCGAALGFFPCLCLDVPRTRVVEHANADLDNGWKGLSHDSGIVEGGGYVTDLWDCDGPSGPDTLCNVGPHCSGGAKSPCSPVAFNVDGSGGPPSNMDTGDEICASLGQGVCRQTPGGQTGPHCELDTQKRCANGGDCQSIVGDRCVETPHGAPLPLASAGVSVCVVNTFSEDVVGTTDLVSGEGEVHLRQFSATILGSDQQQPCPVCGGFCAGTAGEGDQSPNQRTLCDDDSDCPISGDCVTEFICSYGPQKDQPCRPNAPAGGTTEFFGNPSVDCPAAGQVLGTIDIIFDPATTGTVSRTANQPCATGGFNNKTCAGGANQHAVCTVDSQCPGGTCNNQCFCPTAGGIQKPNDCSRACVVPGGAAPDAEPCLTDVDCPGGFCHPGDCRYNNLDNDSSQEGLCTVGPGNSHCSVHTFVACTANSGCQAPTCAFCDMGETCTTEIRQCFVNPTYTRTGAPGVPDRVSAATFCITATGSAAVDNVAGLPGPGAITNPTTVIDTGLAP